MKTVVLLTCPRSGSSLLSGLLHKLGVHMGDKHDLLQSKHKNRFGSFENQEILKLNHKLLYKSKRLMLYWKRLDDKDGLVEKVEVGKRMFVELTDKSRKMIYYFNKIGQLCPELKVGIKHENKRRNIFG